jgi:hypothetical protein
MLLPTFILPQQVQAFPDPWWNESWTYRNVLSFNTTGLTENLTWFPVLVKFTAARFDFDKIEADGADLRFVDKMGSAELPYEIDTWNDTSEEGYVWVQVPQVDMGAAYSDYFWVYYGNGAAADAQDKYAVWSPPDSTLVNGMGVAVGSPITIDGTKVHQVNVTSVGTFTITLPAATTGTVVNSTGTVIGAPVSLVAGANNFEVDGTGLVNVTIDWYVAVYHMNDDAANSTQILDSASNNNTGTKGDGANATIMPTEVAGSVGMAQSFGGSQYIEVADSPSLDLATAGTITAYLTDIGTTGDFQSIVAKQNAVADNTANNSYKLYHRPTERVYTCYWGNGTVADSARTTTTDPEMVSSVYNGVRPLAYANGTYEGQGPAVAPPILNSTGPMRIGRQVIGPDWYLSAKLDELRLSSVARSADWVEYENLAITDTLLYYGNEDPPPSVTTLAATGVTMNAAGVTGGTLNGNITSLGGSPECNATFNYGLTAAYGITLASQTLNTTGTYSAALPTTLTPGATYHFRANATNVDGTANGSDLTFTFTLPTIVTLAPTNVVMDASGTSATLRGQVTNMGAASTATVYFEWGYDASYGTTVGTQVASGTGIYTTTITGFNPSFPVYYRFVSKNGVVAVEGAVKTSNSAAETDTGYTLLRLIPLLVIAATVFMVLKQRGDGWLTILSTILIGVLLFLAVSAILQSMW